MEEENALKGIQNAWWIGKRTNNRKESARYFFKTTDLWNLCRLLYYFF